MKKPASKVTIHDVAKAAGCATSTVSRTLNRSASISDETRQRVHAAIESLGYIPAAAARELRSLRGDTDNRTTDTIALILPFGTFSCSIYGDEYRSRMIFACVREAVLNRFHLIVHGYDPKVEGVLPAPVMMSKVGGVIGRFAEIETITAIAARVPCILLDQWIAESPPGVLKINSDMRGSIRKVIDHLVELGHRRIVFFRCLDQSRRCPLFFSAYREHLESLSLPIPAASERIWELEGQNLHKLLDEFTQSLLIPIQERQITAIVCPGDNYAVGIIKRLMAAGVQVPMDVSVTGYDDDRRFVPAAIAPPTTIRIPFEELAAAAVNQLDNLIRGSRSARMSEILIDAPLIVRDSTGKVRPDAPA